MSTELETLAGVYLTDLKAELDALYPGKIESVQIKFRTDGQVDLFAFQHEGECAVGSGHGLSKARENLLADASKEFTNEPTGPNGEKIITSFVYPPIPVRTSDWQAHYDGDEPDDDGRMRCGWGETKEAAIQRLLECDQ